jgi:hypothetical protein
LRLKEFFRFRRRAELRNRLEGYAVSIVFHVILLLILATITISAGGEGFGFGSGPKGPRVRLSMQQDNVSDQDIEDLIETVEVKPIDVEVTELRSTNLPELASISVPRPSSQRLSKIDTRFSPSSGSVGGLSGQFGAFIGGLRKTGLDVAIIIDATASMQHVIDDIKERSVALVERIQSLVPIARIGVVAFRDKGEDFVVRWTDLSFHASKIETFITNLRADGGGDWEEGVREGLEAAIDELAWRRRSKRVIILVGSSPPHAEDMDAVGALAREFKGNGGVISTIDVTKRMHERYEIEMHEWLYGEPPEKISPLPEFYSQVRESYAEIASNGGGEMAALGSDQELAEQILYFAFGSRWQKEVARYAEKN